MDARAAEGLDAFRFLNKLHTPDTNTSINCLFSRALGIQQMFKHLLVVVYSSIDLQEEWALIANRFLWTLPVSFRKHEIVFRKNLNASKPSEHPPQVEECLKGLGGNIGCRDKTSSWYQKGSPM